MRLRFAFSKLLDEKLGKEIRVDRLSMTPHQYWVAVGKGMERPYTGEYWFNQEVGHYHCAHCDNTLFSYDSKFKSQNGYASFWNHVKNSIYLGETNKEDERDAICKGCQSFVGKITFDGPPPTFVRYSVNSSALKFKLKPWFEDPYIKRQEKVEVKKKNFLESK